MANISMMFGCSTEYLVISKFLGEGREVYVPPVDDHGIDLIVVSKPTGIDSAVLITYQEIQVKSRTEDGLFAAIPCPNPRAHYWFIFYIRDLDTFWLINSEDFVRLASKLLKGKHVGKYSLKLASKTKTGLKIQSKYKEYIVTDFSKVP